MYTFNETLNEIRSFDWAKLIDVYGDAGNERQAIVWREEVDGEPIGKIWMYAYPVRYFENGEWVDTRFFKNAEAANNFARAYVGD